ncbi:MFS transporter [Paenibacillus sacheonensis]|uniref:MFS transporter n=1 Tax=Paenibacillus sacheonensis TaxID=742054 RepID=A0A7X5BUU3_9BACL|nr:MFS transporter [Paenibacillus sacheonensis]MBM7563910.1 DHA1 family putative efflux transporter-like MFS transporter [Paenibacillus sacheonensis]NBC67743.1 MFS transporter [Paenibacillus sacheonensis]
MKTNAYRLTVYALAFGAFFTATSELVVSGILNVIAADLHITLAAAGLLITAYSAAFAVGTPIVISLTSRLERRKVMIGALGFFILGSFASSVSTTFGLLLLSRILLGISSGVYLVVAFGVAARIVPQEKLGSAIGTIVLGFSSAMILGVPLGIAIANRLSWQAIFLLLGIVSLAFIFLLYRLLPKIEGDAPTSFRSQFKAIGSTVIVSALILTFLRESGNSVLFTFMTPFLQQMLHYSVSGVSLMMLAFGVVGAAASRIGGYGVDRWGAARVIVAGVLLHIAALVLLPLFQASVIAGSILLGFVVFSMFAVGPAMQSYFIQRAPQSANLILSLNTSIIHLGLAAGAGAGGVLLTNASTLRYHPWLAGGILLLGLAAGLIGFAKGRARRPSKDALVQANSAMADRR